MDNTKRKNYMSIDEKIKKKENELKILKEKKQSDFMKDMFSIIEKRNIPLQKALNVIETYDFSIEDGKDNENNLAEKAPLNEENEENEKTDNSSTAYDSSKYKNI